MKPSGRGLHKLAIAKIFPNKEMYKLRIGEIMKHTRACFNTMLSETVENAICQHHQNGRHFKQGQPRLSGRFGGLETAFNRMLRENIPDTEFDVGTRTIHAQCLAMIPPSRIHCVASFPFLTFGSWAMGAVWQLPAPPLFGDHSKEECMPIPPVSSCNKRRAPYTLRR
jgi:hypothetical protein